MKLLSILLLLFTATTTVLASLDPQDLTVQRDPTSRTLIVRTIVALEQDAALTLTDRNGRLIYEDSVRAGDYVNKRFPLAALTSPRYELTISDREGKTTQPLYPGSAGPVCRLTEATRHRFPRVDMQDERTLVVNYANQSGKRVSIRIENQAGKTVFTDEVNGPVQRAYQLNRLTSGQYRVKVNGRDLKDYTTAIALR